GGEAIAVTYRQEDEEGLAELRLASPCPAGPATLAIQYDAPFNRSLRGLYRVDEGTGDDEAHYAFTQFEATSARLAFPSFDEPRFKTPFEFTLTVRADDRALFNTPEVDRQDLPGNMVRVRFAPTRPLPTYLVAMAVGPLDVVEHAPIAANDVRSRPLPFRGVATRGKAAQLAYAMEHTGALVHALERYFGIPYPYAKLDIVAVPDFAAGAMENAGLITFRDPLLLLSDESPESQQRAYAYVMAHELAHQWFGNLVTLAWWDDIWLNEAFATWMGYKIADEVFPNQEQDLNFLQRVHSAMHSDSLVSARQVRQPIESNHDIRNAFDSITYRKGGGVLAMFERWLTPEIFRTGVRQYLADHADGVATYRELLSAFDTASGRDVTTAFSTYLFQTGLPFVHASASCEGDAPSATLRQERFLPVGSTGDSDRTWSIPVCVRYGADGEDHTSCNMLSETTGGVPLEACPDWMMPNADGAGYFRFSMAPPDLENLRRRGFQSLTDRELMAYADAIDGGVENASIRYADALSAYEAMASSELRALATSPMKFFRFTAERLVPEAKATAVWRRAGRLYARRARSLGWTPRADENGERALLRADVYSFMLLRVRDARLRGEAVRRAERYLGMGRGGDGEIHADAIAAELVGYALAVAVQEKDTAFFDALIARFRTSRDSILRSRIIAALSASDDSELAARARGLALDSDLRVNELMLPLYIQFQSHDRREEAWEWMTANYAALAERLESGTSRLVGVSGGFCTSEDAARVSAFFGPKIEDIPGGPRTLATTLEAIQLCTARVEAHREGASGVFH
ncbi:MAG: alanyl aminopeptidase, partial [Polyangiales bacterium]